MTTSLLNPMLYASGNPATNGLPLDLYWRMQEESPCDRQELNDPTLIPWTWVLSRHADVLAASRDHRRLSSAAGATVRLSQPILRERGGRPAMMAMDGEDHIRNRRIVSRGFTPVVLRAFEQRVRVIVVEAIEDALDLGRIDFVDDLAVGIPLRAASELIGVPSEDQPSMLQWTNDIATPNDPAQVTGPGQVIASMNSIWDYALQLAALRRAQPEVDLMSKVAAAFEEEQLSEEELQGMLLLLAVGGNETTRNAMTHGLFALLREPAQMRRFRDDTDTLMSGAVEEILRWSSPVIHLRRTARERIDLHGQVIEPGDPVTLMVAAANFDPRVFEGPQQFDIRRSPNPHISFGNGPHVCLGQAVARMELRIFFEELLARTRHIELLGNITYSQDTFVRGVRSLPVELTAR